MNTSSTAPISLNLPPAAEIASSINSNPQDAFNQGYNIGAQIALRAAMDPTFDPETAIIAETDGLVSEGLSTYLVTAFTNGLDSGFQDSEAQAAEPNSHYAKLIGQRHQQMTSITNEEATAPEQEGTAVAALDANPALNAVLTQTMAKIGQNGFVDACTDLVKNAREGKLSAVSKFIDQVSDPTVNQALRSVVFGSLSKNDVTDAARAAYRAAVKDAGQDDRKADVVVSKPTDDVDVPKERHSKESDSRDLESPSKDNNHRDNTADKADKRVHKDDDSKKLEETRTKSDARSKESGDTHTKSDRSKESDDTHTKSTADGKKSDDVSSKKSDDKTAPQVKTPEVKDREPGSSKKAEGRQNADKEPDSAGSDHPSATTKQPAQEAKDSDKARDKTKLMQDPDPAGTSKSKGLSAKTASADAKLGPDGKIDRDEADEAWSTYEAVISDPNATPEDKQTFADAAFAKLAKFVETAERAGMTYEDAVKSLVDNLQNTPPQPVKLASGQTVKEGKQNLQQSQAELGSYLHHQTDLTQFISQTVALVPPGGQSNINWQKDAKTFLQGTPPFGSVTATLTRSRSQSASDPGDMDFEGA